MKGYVTRNFTDAGTTRAFEPDTVVDVTNGEFANYKAAGVMRAATEAEIAAAAPEGDHAA